MRAIRFYRHDHCIVLPRMPFVEVSVILPFRDHEDRIGQACRNLATYLRAQGQTFEILAVDQGSGDNSQSVLALLGHELPELRVIVGRGYGAGSNVAKAEVLVLANVESAGIGVATSLHLALERVSKAEVDMYLVGERLLVARQSSCQKLIASGATRRAKSERGLLDLAGNRGLVVRSYGPLAPRPALSMTRLFAGILPSLVGSSQDRRLLW